MKIKKLYLTETGYQELKKKLHELKTVKRREIAEAIHTAKEQGDLSENAEYSSAKEQQNFLEKEIADLESKIRNVEVIKKGANGAIEVGSTVKVEAFGVQTQYTIVGSAESNPDEGKISNESPLGKAFLGKKAGDEIKVEAPKGPTNYKILSVE